MLSNLNNKAMSTLLRGQIYVPERRPSEEQTEEAPKPKAPEVRQAMPEQRRQENYKETKDELPGQAEQRQAGQNASQRRVTDPIKAAPRIGRNDPCPCGSGKKYKNCHGRGL